MSTAWIDELRVVDLKEELKKRELLVTGKKAELAARLREAVEAEAGDTGPEPAKDGKTPVAVDTGADESEADAEGANEVKSPGKAEPSTAAVKSTKSENAEEAQPEGDVKETEVSAAPAKAEETKSPESKAPEPLEGKGTKAGDEGSKAAEKVEETADLEAETADKVPQDAEADEETPAQEDEAAAVAKSNERHDADPVPEVGEQPAEAPNAAVAAAAEPLSGTPVREERLPAMQAALLAPQASVPEVNQDAEMEEAVDFEADDAEEPEAQPTEAEQKEAKSSTKTPRDQAASAEEPEAKRQKQDEELSRQDSGRRKREPIPLFKSRDKVPAAATPSGTSDPKSLERRSSVFDRIGSLNDEVARVGGTGAPPTRAKPTRALLVTGFIRPFTLTAAQNLFKTYGEVEKMWMTNVRDKAYVIFKAPEAAEAARQGTHGLEWPHGNRTSLRPKFIAEDEAETVISSEGREAPPAQARPAGTPSAAKTAAAAATARSTGPPSERQRAEKVNGGDSTNTRGKGSEKEEKKPEELGLEDLFRKTVTVPHLYWVPLKAEQIAEKQKTREKTREEGKKA